VEVTKESKDLNREQAKEIARHCTVKGSERAEWILLVAAQNVYGGGR